MGVETPSTQSAESKYVGARRKRRRRDRQRAALGWWVGTVVLTLFPTLATFLVVALQENKELTLELIFGDGEIILASFLIVASTSMAGYNVKDKTVFTDLVRYILFFLGAAQLIAYTTIKTNDKNTIVTVIIISVASLFMSICTSWIWYKLASLSEEVYNDERY